MINGPPNPQSLLPCCGHPVIKVLPFTNYHVFILFVCQVVWFSFLVFIFCFSAFLKGKYQQNLKVSLIQMCCWVSPQCTTCKTIKASLATNGLSLEWTVTRKKFVLKMHQSRSWVVPNKNSLDFFLDVQEFFVTKWRCSVAPFSSQKLKIPVILPL